MSKRYRESDVTDQQQQVPFLKGRDSLVSNTSFRSSLSFKSNASSNRPKYRMPLESMAANKRKMDSSFDSSED